VSNRSRVYIDGKSGAAVRRASLRATASQSVQRCSVKVINATVPGRMRLSVQGLHRNRVLASELDQKLRPEGPVFATNSNCLTGNILIQFDRRTSYEAIVEWLDQRLDRKKFEWQQRDDKTAVAAAANAGGSRTNVKGSAQRIVRGRRATSDVVSSKDSATGPDNCWQCLTIDETIRELKSDGRTGLNSAEAERRLTLYGRNAIDEIPPPVRLLSSVVNSPVCR
jgi:hypothetical protein